jgi:hypothetical protein
MKMSHLRLVEIEGDASAAAAAMEKHDQETFKDQGVVSVNENIICSIDDPSN